MYFDQNSTYNVIDIFKNIIDNNESLKQSFFSILNSFEETFIEKELFDFSKIFWVNFFLANYDEGSEGKL